ncbi:hypothetical protein PanWU01x14_099050 [Parasponia andersonii]|uniref:Uncharacterized protein n=1 Tax=Parasponia andersonii TaxID=3476 RepID=A0A2P5D486_PARAD|nr:hypothetical protein PanWU01x14_099050 [Parasponia andersonii]
MPPKSPAKTLMPKLDILDENPVDLKGERVNIGLVEEEKVQDDLNSSQVILDHSQDLLEPNQGFQEKDPDDNDFKIQKERRGKKAEKRKPNAIDQLKRLIKPIKKYAF